MTNGDVFSLEPICQNSRCAVCFSSEQKNFLLTDSAERVFGVKGFETDRAHGGVEILDFFQFRHQLFTGEVAAAAFERFHKGFDVTHTRAKGGPSTRQNDGPNAPLAMEVIHPILNFRNKLPRQRITPIWPLQYNASAVLVLANLDEGTHFPSPADHDLDASTHTIISMIS